MRSYPPALSVGAERPCQRPDRTPRARADRRHARRILLCLLLGLSGVAIIPSAASASSVASHTAFAGVARASSVTNISVTDTPPSAGSTARTIYTVVFTTSATGGLSGSAASQISVTLPSGTSAASMNNSSVVDLTATGHPQVGDCFEGATAVDVTCDMFGGSSVAAGDQVSVQLDGIINPTVASATSETLQVATTSDTTPVNSGPYTIQPAHAMAASSVTDTPPSAGSTARTIYTVVFTTSATGGLSGSAASQISVTLPSGTSAASMNNSSVVDLTATGQPQVGDCFEGATAVDVTCDMFGGSSVAAGDQVSVQLDGIINPTVASATSETLQVATTSDTTPVNSGPYTIQPAHAMAAPR